MGNIIRSRISHDEDVEMPPLSDLTPQQVMIIKRTYEIPASKLFDFGEHVFFQYLEQYPENQHKFRAFKNTPLLLLKGTPGFRAHASRIMNVFSCIIDALDKDPNLTDICKLVADVGRLHENHKISKRAFNQLRGVFMTCLTIECNLDKEEIDAWQTLLDIFMHIIFECLEGKSDKFYQKTVY